MKSSLKHKCIRLWPVLLLLCPALLLLQTGLHLFAGDYERALHTLMHDLQRPDLEPVLRTRYFNVRLYPYLKTTVFNLPFVCMAAAIYLSYKYENRVVQAWQGIQQIGRAHV